MGNKVEEQWPTAFDSLPELKCKGCGVVFRGGHVCEYEMLKQQNIKLHETLQWIVDCSVDYQSINKARQALEDKPT